MAFFSHGYSKGFACGIAVLHCFMRLYGALCEHVRFSYELSVFVDHFKCCKKIV